MTNPFIYDPSKDIKRAGQESSDLVSQAFKPVIQKKINDFNMVKDLYDNIEVERQNLEQYNEGLINKKIDESLSNLSNAILSNGKLDYKKIGEMKQQVSAIRSAKVKSRVVADEFRDKIGLLYKNADKMHDIEGTVSEMKKVLNNPDFLFSPEDASAKLGNIYAEGVDMSRLLQSRLKQLSKKSEGSFMDKEGNLIQVKADLVPGYQLGPNGDIVQVGDDNERKRSIGQLLSEQEKAVFARQLGPAMAFDGDVDNYISSTVGDILRSSRQSVIKESALKRTKDTIGIQKTVSDIKNSRERLDIARQNAATQAGSLELRNRDFNEKLKGGYYNKESKGSSNAEFPLNSNGSLSMGVEVDGVKYTRFSKNPGGTINVYYEGGKEGKVLRTEEEINTFRSQMAKAQKDAFDRMPRGVTPAKAKPNAPAAPKPKSATPKPMKNQYGV